MLERVFESLFLWQLTRDGRRPWPVAARCVVIGMAAVFFWWAFSRVYPLEHYSRFDMPRREAAFRATFTVPCLYVLFYGCLALTPGLFSPLIARDRESRLLDLLLTTQLNREQIVLGRWGSRFVQLLALFIAAVPVLIVAGRYGGARSDVLAGVLFAALCTAISLSAVATLTSALARTAREAFAAAYAAPLVVAMLPHAVDELGAALADAKLISRSATNAVSSAAGWWDRCASPIGLFESLAGPDAWSDRSSLGPRLALFGVVHLTATLVLWRLAVRAIGPGGEGAKERWLRARRRLFVRRAWRFGATPVFWREWRSGPGGVWAVVQNYAFVVSTCLALYLPFYSPIFKPFRRLWRLFGDWREGDYGPFYLWTGGMLFTFGLLQVLQNAGNAIATERDRDTWQMLLSTRLTAKEMVRQKVLASLRPAAVLLALWFPLTVLLWTQGHADAWCVAAPLVTIPGFAFFVAALSFLFTLRARRPWSGMMAAIGVGVFVFVLLSLFQAAQLATERPGSGSKRFREDVVSLADGRWLLSSPFLVAPFERQPDPRWSVMLFGVLLFGVGGVLMHAAIDQFPALTGRSEYGLSLQPARRRPMGEPRRRQRPIVRAESKIPLG